jgi:hypothetical protein
VSMLSVFQTQLGRFRPRRSVTLLLTFAMLLVTAVSAMSYVLVSNLDPANQGVQTVKGTIASGLNGQTAGGISFTVPTAASYYLNSISLDAKYSSGASTSFEIAIYSDSSNLPSAQLFSRTLAIDNVSTTLKTYTADFGTGTELTAGTTYWAIVQATGATNDLTFTVRKGTLLPDDPDGLRRAMYGNMGAKLPDGVTPAPPYWMHMWTPGIQVLGTFGTPVPEPSGLLALSCGTISSVGYVIRKRRRTSR